MKDLKRLVKSFLFRRGYETDNSARNTFEKGINKVSFWYQQGISGGLIYCPDHVTIFINDEPIIVNEDESYDEIYSYLEFSFSRYEK